MAFSFGFSGEDIDTSLDDGGQAPQAPPPPFAAGAFPVQGKPQLPPTHHPLDDALRRLPSRVSWSYLETTLDDGTAVRLPRRDLWDVRVQLMAEDDGAGADGGGGEGLDGLGNHDVKTGVYEGGFKSWESSIDLIKVLAANSEGCFSEGVEPVSVVELGCGTALPSLAILQTALSNSSALRRKLHLTLADYNPSVLLLVTLPNVLVTWALTQTSTPLIAEALAAEGELEISPELLSAFCSHLAESNISLSLLSGGWSPGFVDLIYAHTPSSASLTLMLGSETIYSPFALQSFTETIFSIYSRDQQRGAKSVAYVAAKKLYFGVGGSLDDFITGAQERGAMVKTMREELEGVRRGVVRCSLTDD